jgi:hypothetical protein
MAARNLRFFPYSEHKARPTTIPLNDLTRQAKQMVRIANVPEPSK